MTTQPAQTAAEYELNRVEWHIARARQLFKDGDREGCLEALHAGASLATLECTHALEAEMSAS